MLSRLLISIYAAEFGIYFILWMAGWLPLLGAVAIALTLRAFIVARMFRTSERHRCKRPDGMTLNATGWVRLVFAEYASICALYFLFHPITVLFARRGPYPLLAGGTPVLMIHGYCCDGGFWWSMRRYLARHGVTQTHILHCEPLFGDIDVFAEQVAARIGAICERTGARQVILVGHSMGGLIARRCVQLYGAEGIAAVITLGSPHHGTIHAHGGPGTDARQMRLNNPWLAELNRDEDHPPVPTVSIFSYHDNVVAPQTSPILSGARNVPLCGVGHLEMAFSRRVHALVLEAIQAATA